MNNFIASYEKILEYIKSNTNRESFLQQIRKPKLTDIEVILINLTAEYMGIDSECQLFREMPESLLSRRAVLLVLPKHIVWNIANPECLTSSIYHY